MASSSTSIVLAAGGLLAALLLYLRKPKSTPASLPPGPKPVPLIGNIRDLTIKELWLPASQWFKQYGDVVYLHLFGQGLVFLNSPEAAFDLLDKRGSIYSDKPSFVMAGELCGCKNMVAFTPYSAQSKRQRRLMHKAFGLPIIPTYHPLIVRETSAFLRRLVASPAAYGGHLRRYAGGLTLSVVYGYDAGSQSAGSLSDGPSADSNGSANGQASTSKSTNTTTGATRTGDPFLDLAEECVALLSEKIASGGGVWPVDVFPALRHLPEWAPGAGFLRDARRWKRKMEEFVDGPYAFVRKSMKSGNYKPSFCSNLLEDTAIQGGGEKDEFEFDLKWSANSMYSGSIDTTITTVSHFLLAMLAHPAAQQRAHAEIDAVVGTDRLPGFSDRESLPYVEAVYREVLRWGVPVPLNLPHRLMEDDVYRGMFIPKGSMVFGNIWAMLRNETLYPDPDSFKPERFLADLDGKSECTEEEAEMRRRRDPKRYVFGFGRRQCPGMNLVDSSIWLVIACMLATLDVAKALDEHGRTVEPDVRFENPIFRIPSAFKCDIRPRTPKALELIRGVGVDA